MRNLLLALALLCFAALGGGEAFACPAMQEMATNAPASATQVAHGEAHVTSARAGSIAVEAGSPCHPGSGTPSCGGVHACCALPVLRAPEAAAHRWPRRVSYVVPQPPVAQPAPTVSLDRPPKIRA